MRPAILRFVLAAGLFVLPAAIPAWGQEDLMDHHGMYGTMHGHGMMEGMSAGGCGMPCGDQAGGKEAMDSGGHDMMQAFGGFWQMDLTPEQHRG